MFRRIIFAAAVFGWIAPAVAQIPGGGGGVPKPVINGECLIGSGGNAVWGSCSGAGTSVTSVTGTMGQISVAPGTGDTIVSLPNTITKTLTFSGANNYGTPSAINLASGTNLPITTGVSGLGTGTATALGVNVGTAGSFIVNGGALGTPSSGTLTNVTGLPISSGVSGLGVGVATFLATPSGANLATALTTPLTSNKGGTGLTSFTRLGNTTSFATTSGSFTTGHCVDVDSNSNFVDAGVTCGGGGGGGTPVVFVGPTTAGTAPSFTIATPTPSAGFTLTDGYTVVTRFHADGAGSDTLNVASTGAVPIDIQSAGGLIPVPVGYILANTTVHTLTYYAASNVWVDTTAMPGNVTFGATTGTIAASDWVNNHLYVVTATGQSFALATGLPGPTGGVTFFAAAAFTLTTGGPDTMTCGGIASLTSCPVAAGSLVQISDSGGSPNAFTVQDPNAQTTIDLTSAGAALTTDYNGKTLKIAAFTYTLAQAGTTGFKQGWGACVINTGTGNATITATTSVFSGAPGIAGGGTTSLTVAPNGWACPSSDGTNYVTNVGGASLVAIPMSLGWTAGADIDKTIIVASTQQALVITAIQGVATVLLGSAGTIDVWDIASGTSTCTSGTKVTTSAFNANTAAGTPQSLLSSAYSLAANHSLCISVTSGTFTGGNSRATITAYGHPT